MYCPLRGLKVWNGFGKVNIERVINRGYEELVKGLKFERVNYMKDLPCAVNVDEYFDDTTVGNKHLPCDVMM